MKNERNDYDWTNNRNYYNKLRKHYLESVGDIRCSYCKYNRGENSRRKWYGGFEKDTIKYPSWKMISKNKSQWMGKDGYKVTKKVIERTWRDPYTLYEIFWKNKK